MKRFDAVIFDMDGLLVDSEKVALETFLECCRICGLGDETDLFLKCIGANEEQGRKILKKGLEGKVDLEVFGVAWRKVFKERDNREPIPLKPGAMELLLHIRTLGIPMAVATSTGTDRAVERLKASDLYPFFKEVIGGEQAKASKPAPEIYLKAAKILGADPLKCLALEDSEKGVKSAHAAGMTVIQIPDLVKPDKNLLKMGHIVLDSLSDVPDYRFMD